MEGVLMQMVKIHIPDQTQRAKALLELIRRGRVICLTNDLLVVPEPALGILRTLGVTFQEITTATCH
ncbi:MAG TPA: hypothetical protein VK797_29080 [Tepidisphaeraceae bacterium]|nr:hypothetical protein [Tepidisphaeraceae bacterium]